MRWNAGTVIREFTLWPLTCKGSMLTIRLRTRDGTERIQVRKDAKLWDLRATVSEQIERPTEGFVLSLNRDLLQAHDPDTFFDLAEDTETLEENGFVNGQMVYCFYAGTRDVSPGYKRTELGQRPFGTHMDIPQLVAKQMRIARQDQPTVAAASFDRYAANSFQAYVQSALNFSIQRGALLYGRVDEKDNTVYVDVMYEPPQQGEAERLSMDIECEEVWLSAA